MHKVVFNNCYGGFSLSLKAVKWLERNSKDESLLARIKQCKEYCNKHAVYFVDQMLCYNVSYIFDDKRHHKDLVAVVESLGDEANGECASLVIKEINSNKYRIDKYDGAESIITPEDSEGWIFIED